MSRPTCRSTGFAAGLVTTMLALGCATPPKPPELEALEKMRQDPSAVAAAKRSPDLVATADARLNKAREHWQDSDLYEARRDALRGQIALKAAFAVNEQHEARARIQAADTEYRQVAEEYTRLDKELQTLNEGVALLKRLGEERAAAAAERQKAEAEKAKLAAEVSAEKQKLAAQMSAEKQAAEAEKAKLAAQIAAEQQRGAAAEKLRAAQLALKTSETVEAPQHAQPQYAAAADMLTRAQTEFAKNDYPAVMTSAELARQKAEEATVLARPKYEAAGQNAANKTRDEALSRDSAGITGVVVRLERRGDVQRLVLPLQSLFVKKDTSIAPGHEEVLDAIGNLLKKYPTYPVQVVGYTDNRGKPENLISMSLARANSVFSALVARGVDPKRMMVSGQGPSDPVSDNKTAPGRGRNNRVEIIFLYH